MHGALIFFKATSDAVFNSPSSFVLSQEIGTRFTGAAGGVGGLLSSLWVVLADFLVRTLLSDAQFEKTVTISGLNSWHSAL